MIKMLDKTKSATCTVVCVWEHIKSRTPTSCANTTMVQCRNYSVDYYHRCCCWLSGMSDHDDNSAVDDDNNDNNDEYDGVA